MKYIHIIGINIKHEQAIITKIKYTIALVVPLPYIYIRFMRTYHHLIYVHLAELAFILLVFLRLGPS